MTSIPLLRDRLMVKDTFLVSVCALFERTVHISHFFQLQTGIIICDGGLAHSMTALLKHGVQLSRGPASVCVCVPERESECLPGQTRNWCTQATVWSEPATSLEHTHRGTHKGTEWIWQKRISAYGLHFNKLRE